MNTFILSELQIINSLRVLAGSCLSKMNSEMRFGKSQHTWLQSRVTGQNGSGQNGTDKMVYGQNGIRTKWYWTKWYGQNGMDKMVRTKWYRQNGMDKMIQFHILCTF